MWRLVLSTIVVLLILIYQKLRKRYNFWKDKGVKYVEPRLIFGNFHLFNDEPASNQIVKFYNTFPDERSIGLYLFTNPLLMLRDPELIKKIGIKDFEHFTDHLQFVDPEIDLFWTRNLLALRGSKWHDMRMTLSPSFSSSKMKMLFYLIDECARNFVQYLNQAPQDLNELEMKDLFTRYTNDVVATAAFGLKCDSLKNRKNEFYLMGKKITEIKGFRLVKLFIFLISPVLSKLFRITFIDPKVGDYFGNIIKETVWTREEKHIVRLDMVHLLMEAMKGRIEEEQEDLDDFAKHHKDVKKSPITIDDIISQALIFFLAGFETTSTLLSFYFYEMARNPDIQSRLRQEIEDTVKETDGTITYEKLLSLKYLDMTVSEALRIWPPVVFTDRKVTKSYTIEAEKSDERSLVLEEGVLIWFPIIALHRDPKYFPDPDKYDPERFNDENKSKINPLTYMPFGIGPRICIGNRIALLEGKLLIYYILQNFKIVPVKRTQIPIVLDPSDGNLAPKGGMWLGFKKIKK